MPTAEITLPNGKTAEIDFDTEDQLRATIADLERENGAQAQQEAPQEPMWKRVLKGGAREVGRGVRNLSQAAMALPAMAVDWPSAAYNVGAQLVGSEKRLPGMGTELLIKPFDYEAIADRTPQERLSSDLTRGIGGVMTGTALAPVAGLPAMAARPGTQLLAAESAAGASGLTREAGGGEVAQTLAGLAAGIAVPATWQAIKGTASATGNAIASRTQSGREVRAGEIMRQSAADPARARSNMQQASQIVKGSEPTASEVAKDYGISGLERAVKSKEPKDFAARASQQNTARNVALDKVSGGSTPDRALRTLIANRENATKQLRDRAFSEAGGGGAIPKNPVEALKNAKDQGQLTKAAQALKLFESDTPTPQMKELESLFLKQSKALPAGQTIGIDATKIVAKLDDMLANPDNAGAGTQKVLQSVKKQIEGQSNARALYAIRKEIGETIKSGFDSDSSPVRYATKQLRDVQLMIDDAIGEVAPSWKPYLEKYAKLSKPIERMENIQAARQKSSLAAPDSMTGREVLSQAKLKNQVANLEDARLTRGQTKVLRDVLADVNRSTAKNDPNIRAIGSNTAQDTAAISQLGNLLKHGVSSKVPLVGRFIDILNTLDEAKVNKIVESGLLNPKEGAKLMMLAEQAKTTPVTFGDTIRQSTIGSMYGTQ